MSINNKTLKNEFFEIISTFAVISIFESSIEFIDSSRSFAIDSFAISIEFSKSKNRIFIFIDELISFSKQFQRKISHFHRKTIFVKIFSQHFTKQFIIFKNINTLKTFVVIDYQKKMSSKIIQISNFHEYFSKDFFR